MGVLFFILGGFKLYFFFLGSIFDGGVVVVGVVLGVVGVVLGVVVDSGIDSLGFLDSGFWSLGEGFRSRGFLLVGVCLFTYGVRF